MEKIAGNLTAMDRFKLVAAMLVLASTLVAFYAFAAQPALVKVLGLLVGVGVAIYIGLQTQPGRALWAFRFEVRAEVRKVVWPSRQETTQTTLVVVVMVVVMALLLWMIDMVLFMLVRFLTGQGG